MTLPSLVPGTLFGSRWIVGRVLGKGELAAVYEAEEARAARFAALKLLDSALVRDTEAWTRFETLTRSVAQIPGEGIARSYDAGVSEGRPFIVTERCVFPTLSRYVAERGALSLRAFRETLGTLSAALDAVHAAGITHGNLKPQNLFVSVDNPGWARLTDFGLAELRETSGVHHPRTLGWNAPEVSPGSPTPASDLYTLGLLCFFALSGSPWFSAQRATTASGVARPRSASERARSFGGEIPLALDAWFEQALAHNPSERFASAFDMAQAFSRALDDPGPNAPESAHPLSATLPVPDAGPFSHAGVSLRKQVANAPTIPAPAALAPTVPTPAVPAPALPKPALPALDATLPHPAREERAFPSMPGPLPTISTNPPAQTPSLPAQSPSLAPRPSMIVPPVSVILVVLAALVLGVFALGTVVLVLFR